jgi:hypothetical protein
LVSRHLLRDHSAERESEDVAGGHAQAVQEIQRMRRHTGHRCWHLTGGPAYTSVIEQNHFSRRCQRIRHRRIPVLEGAHEVLQAQQGPTWSAAESSVGICVVLHLEELRRGADVAGCRNG